MSDDSKRRHKAKAEDLRILRVMAQDPAAAGDV
jgi:hypothetical protein